MGERLTDTELADAFAHARGSLRLTAALAELVERRAADLSKPEISLIDYALDHLSVNRWGDQLAEIEVLREKLAAHGGKT
jgi:hypothetical protein